MIPTVIVLPVRDRLDLTQSIVTQLRHQPGWDELVVYDNGSSGPTKRYLNSVRAEDDRIVIQESAAGIYDMWDDGYLWATGVHPGAVNVLFLNNDITLQPRVVELLTSGLRSRDDLIAVYPDYTHRPGECVPDVPVPYLVDTLGSYRHGGLVGWCFALAAERVSWEPLVDPQFEWWCGEDDIVFNAEAAGLTAARAECVVAEHLGSATAIQHEWVGPAVARDMERCLEKWGR